MNQTPVHIEIKGLKIHDMSNDTTGSAKQRGGPLRERKGDIPDFVGFFIKELNPRMGLNIQDITPKALEALMAHDWPGNIRELRNVIERAMLFCDDPAIGVAHLPPELVK